MAKLERWVEEWLPEVSDGMWGIDMTSEGYKGHQEEVLQ
jgi:hypothetical protein